MAKKGIPARDGRGKGTRASKGRGGCSTPRKSGKRLSTKEKQREPYRINTQ